MPEVRLRKNVLILEEIFHEGGPVAQKPLKRVAALGGDSQPIRGRVRGKDRSASWTI